MSALALRIIACTAMLIDHIGYTWGIDEFRAVGRIAFPIFLFLIYNGYRHTKSKLRYAVRLGICAVISQIPFSLFLKGEMFISNINVFFALLLALLCIIISDKLRSHRIGRYFCLAPFLLCYALYLLGMIRADNGPAAIVLAAVFMFFDGDKPVNRFAVSAGLFIAVFHGYALSVVKYTMLWMIGASSVFPIPGNWQMMQIYALAALAVIFAYNGEKGYTPKNPVTAKAMQWGFYLFYPLHMAVLTAIKHL